MLHGYRNKFLDYNWFLEQAKIALFQEKIYYQSSLLKTPLSSVFLSAAKFSPTYSFLLHSLLYWMCSLRL